MEEVGIFYILKVLIRQFRFLKVFKQHPLIILNNKFFIHFLKHKKYKLVTTLATFKLWKNTLRFEKIHFNK